MCYSFRRLTLMGKITVFKSLAASLLVDAFSSLRMYYTKCFFSFLWNQKGDKIKRDTIIYDYLIDTTNL